MCDNLSRPYDQRRINSFPSSISSNTHMNNVSGCDEIGTPGRSGERERPQTPREVQLHFPLETQCSPIPGIPEEHDSDHASDSQAASDASSSHRAAQAAQGTVLTSDSSSKEGSNSSESTAGKMRRLRPMPDISAFESVAQSSRGSADDSATLDSKGLHSSPRLLCPPTPVRTPAWASEGHAFLGGRQNSLITTKVLLSCPSQVLEGRCSLETSVLDDDSKVSGRILPSGDMTFSQFANDCERTRTLASEDEFPDGTPKYKRDAHEASKSELAMKTPQTRIPAPPKLISRLSSGEIGSVTSFSTDFDTLAILGSGAFADVYKVRSKRDNRLYAVKRNRRQFRGKRDREMALAEVQSMQRLQSVCASNSGQTSGDDKNSYCLYVLFFYRAWQEDGYFFSQTELCCRDTCRELIDSLRINWSTSKSSYPSLLRNLPAPKGVEPGSDRDVHGRLVPQLTIWKICHDIAAGLSHIHSHGVVHNDIKPSNIFFVEHARFGAMCKIGDFGMAGDIGSKGDGLEGDARYMPPELLSSGARHPGSDIFSLGLTLFELSTDQHLEMPSEGPRWHELRSGQAPNLPACREGELVDLIKLMTSPDVNQRPNADFILMNVKVCDAGRGCDKFLRDYIRDIQEFDRIEEERLATEHHEDQTPQNGPHRVGVRSPSFGMILPTVPNLFSPTAHRMQ